ncbi:hypothetical protein K469DRAFT_734944 [Zopfia rhizophila CBS 207.26]|uniref:Uncharacterized protein n=1 Tax=Zopfia rhizophila CBS 207.26 TaxID=1314779 RepID=A0A6A6EUG9_9PEZI|nr:hypothetical protein K469DRAFT_734944 [Zopfia rhizophila CBS 207.26]
MASPVPPISVQETQNPSRFPSESPNGEGSAAALEALARQPKKPFYRPAKSMTSELGNHTKVYLEDRQYVEGFALLNHLLTSNTSISTPERPYQAFIAPPSQLALASSLIAYPVITTKARSADAQKGANAALRYLRNVQAAIDPLDENLISAFTFPYERSRRRTGGYRSVESRSPKSDDGEDSERLSGAAANAQSIWQRADDFWHIIGWAFNCSVAYKKRWERWKLWLEIMLDFVEADWKERMKLTREAGPEKEKILMASLLWQYVASQDPQGRVNRRRIIEAVLAMASSQSKKEFPEIWQEETMEPKPEDQDVKEPKKIDIENDDFGDYERDDEDEIMENVSTIPTRASRRVASTRKTPGLYDDDSSSKGEDNPVIYGSDEAVARLGGMDAIVLRQRLLALLVHVAEALPSHFTPLDDLFDHYTEAFRPLPTILFGLLLSTSQLPQPIQLCLNANLLLPLVSGELPNYTIISPTQEHLERNFLPSGAATNSFAANAKTSLILEQMFMLMMGTKSLTATSSLRKAVEKGIEARDKAYGNATRKKGNQHEEDQSKELMELSKERLLGLLEVLEIEAGKAPQPRRVKPVSFSASSSLSPSISLSSPIGNDAEEYG